MSKNLIRIIWSEELESLVEFKNQEKKINAKIIRDKKRKPILYMSKYNNTTKIKSNAPTNAEFYSKGQLHAPKRCVIQYYEQNN